MGNADEDSDEDPAWDPVDVVYSESESDPDEVCCCLRFCTVPFGIQNWDTTLS